MIYYILRCSEIKIAQKGDSRRNENRKLGGDRYEE